MAGHQHDFFHDSKQMSQNESLGYAIQENDPDLVQQALAKGANPNAKDSSSGLPMLIYASQKADTDILQILLDKGANINVQTSGSGHTALMTAAMRGEAGMVSFLIERGADLQIKTKDGKKASDYAKSPQVKSVFERLGAAEVVVKKNLPVGMSKEIAKYAGSKRKATSKRRRRSTRKRSRA